MSCTYKNPIEKLHFFFREKIEHTLYIYDKKTDTLEKEASTLSFDCTSEDETLLINGHRLTKDNCRVLLINENVFIMDTKGRLYVFMAKVPSYIKYLCEEKAFIDFCNLSDRDDTELES